MPWPLEQIITPEERRALQAIARAAVGLTTPLPDTHGVVLLSTREDALEPPVAALPPVVSDH